MDTASMVPPDPDALREVDALQESQVVATHFDAAAGTLATLLDLRVSLQYRHNNSALIVCHGVQGFAWDGFRRLVVPDRLAWTVLSSTFNVTASGIEMTLLLFPDGSFTVGAVTAVLYIGNVPALPNAPPDFTEDAAHVDAVHEFVVRCRLRESHLTVLQTHRLKIGDHFPVVSAGRIKISLDCPRLDVAPDDRRDR
jgi:hypothetical protein